MSQLRPFATPAQSAPIAGGAALNSYDRLPSEPRPLPATLPDTLAVTAALAGLSTAPVTACRVLEIGCAVGGNLLPMAQALPGSTFVGIDLSARQIAAAQRTATGAGIQNVRLEVKDFTTLTAEDGPFDYIIAHGIYGCVAPAARDQLLPVISRLLAPDGVAYVNYYVYPGWHTREMFREIVLANAQIDSDPRAAAADVRRALQMMADQSPTNAENLYAAHLRQETAFLHAVPDEYLIHEYLEANPTAIYFQQFVQQLAECGLGYAAEIKPNPSRRRLANELMTRQPDLAQDWMKLEQYIDFVQGAFVRRSLLCRAGRQVFQFPRPEVIERLILRALALPAVTQGDVRSNEPIPFRVSDGKTVDISDPLVKTTLAALARGWPRALSFEEMLAVIRSDLQFGGQFALPGSQEREAILHTALNLYGLNMVDLHEHAAVFVPVASEKPKATALARYQARESKMVASLHHALVTTLSKTDRLVLAHLNGARDRGALMAVLRTAIGKGILPDPAKDPEAAAEAGLQGPLENVLEQSLGKLANEGFLIEQP